MWTTLRIGFDGLFDRLRELPGAGPATAGKRRLGGPLLALGIVCGLSLISLIEAETGHMLLIGSFGATGIIVFTLPESDYAQPWNVIAGHALATLVGLVGFRLGGGAWWSIGPTVAIAYGAMMLTDSLHPPAGADPIIMVTRQATDIGFLFGTVLAGTLLLVLTAVLWHAAISGRRYPVSTGCERRAPPTVPPRPPEG